MIKIIATLATLYFVALPNLATLQATDWEDYYADREVDRGDGLYKWVYIDPISNLKLTYRVNGREYDKVMQTQPEIFGGVPYFDYEFILILVAQGTDRDLTYFTRMFKKIPKDPQEHRAKAFAEASEALESLAEASEATGLRENVKSNLAQKLTAKKDELMAIDHVPDSDIFEGRKITVRPARKCKE